MSSTIEKQKNTITISAPGKILIAGGYLVLESPNIGIVIAADKRFYSTVTSLEEPSVISKEDVTDEETDKFEENLLRSIVDVHSPQYDAIFSYFLYYPNPSIKRSDKEEDDTKDETLVKLIPRSKSQSPNPFIERTLLLTFSYIFTTSQTSKRNANLILPSALGIKLRADNDFYSQISNLQSRSKFPATPKDVESLPPFLPAGEHKTGMGSSAALVTSLVGSLYSYFLLDNRNGNNSSVTSGTSKDCIHALAQTAHSLAQGKIGSGFDVSAAVFGTHMYKRFLPEIIQPILSNVSLSSSIQTTTTATTTQSFGSILQDCIHDTNGWKTCGQTPFELPNEMEILMADVCGGSESPSMARKVLAWHRSSEIVKDVDYWEELKVVNDQIAQLFTELDEQLDLLEKEEENGLELRKSIFDFVATTTSKEWSTTTTTTTTIPPFHSSTISKKILNQIYQIRTIMTKSRHYLKSMGNAANVPIEPKEQTELANATMDLPGVIVAGVPGAGGFDALFCLYVKKTPNEEKDGNDDCVRDSIAKLWGGWKGGANQEGGQGEKENVVVSPMGVRAVGWGEGLKVEKEIMW